MGVGDDERGSFLIGVHSTMHLLPLNQLLLGDAFGHRVRGKAEEVQQEVMQRGLVNTWTSTISSLVVHDYLSPGFL